MRAVLSLPRTRSQTRVVSSRRVSHRVSKSALALFPFLPGLMCSEGPRHFVSLTAPPTHPPCTATLPPVSHAWRRRSCSVPPFPIPFRPPSRRTSVYHMLRPQVNGTIEVGGAPLCMSWIAVCLDHVGVSVLEAESMLAVICRRSIRRARWRGRSQTCLRR